jgi:hypothetical protein
MPNYQTDQFALGVSLAPRGGVYPQMGQFSTVSPGSGLAASVLLGTSDYINLFYIPTPGRLFNYSIDLGRLDQGSALVLRLEDAQGNVFVSGLTTGQAGGRITDATAAVALMGNILYTSPASAYLRLRAVTAAGLQITNSAIVNGTYAVRHE